MPGFKKSIRIFFQNSTNELLTVEGFGCLQGIWVEGREPVEGQVIPRQGGINWESESLEEGTGTALYLRIGSTKGYILVQARLPWCGSLEYSVKAAEMLVVETSIYEEDGEHPAILVTLASSICFHPELISDWPEPVST